MKPEVRALYLHAAQIPRVARAGEPVEIAVRGALPNPGWKFLRWEFDARGDADEESLTRLVTPLIVYALSPDERVPQVEVPYEADVRVEGSERPGLIGVEVRGYAPEETVRGSVEIVPANTLLDVEISGGFAGIRDRVRVGEDGAFVATRSLDGRRASGSLSQAELAEVREALAGARIPNLDPLYRSENAADLFLYDVTSFGSGAARVVADELAAPEELSALVQLLRGIAQQRLGPVRR